jgi:pimeloyl-ACP methyl ester carboxylesterase
MLRRLVPLALLVLALGTALAPATARSSGKGPVVLTPCDKGKPLLCGQVEVPLDYSGKIPDTIKLSFVKLPAKGTPRGTMFMIAGGPGQGSIEAYGLKHEGAFFQSAFPGYDLVAFDDRGTGISAPLSCPALEQRIVTAGAFETADLVGICGRQLGDYRLYFGTRDHADDLEMVRRALGLGKIGLYGVSYGTKESMAYVMAYPQNVERVLLDSVVPPEGPDLYSLDTLAAIPVAMGRLCGGGACEGLTTDLGRDVATLANRFEAKPLFLMEVQDPTKIAIRGKPIPVVKVHLDGYRFMNLIVDADLLPPVANELPAAIAAAVHGWYEPIKRLYLLDAGSGVFKDIDVGLFAATTCDDGTFPWSPLSDPTGHLGAYKAAVAALPSGATGIFGSWSAEFGTAAMCIDWPSPSGARALTANPLPDVPVLVLSGDRDTRTPTPGGKLVASRFPHSYLTVVPGVGHSVLGSDFGGCAESSVVGWLDGKIPPPICPPSPPLLTVKGIFSKNLASTPVVGKVGGKPGKTLGAVVSTLEDAFDLFLFEQFSVGLDDTPGLLAKPGLAGGLIVSKAIPAGFARQFELTRYSVVPGVEVSGILKIFPSGLPLQFQGNLVVTGDKAAKGKLTLRASSLSGTLGGKAVSGTTGRRGLFGPAVKPLRRPFAG